MLRRALDKLHNFRLLPVFVLVSMIIGIAIGKWYGISNFALTPLLMLAMIFAIP